MYNELTDIYKFNSQTGIQIPDTGDVIDDITERFKAIFGNVVLDGNGRIPTESPMGRLVEMLAKMIVLNCSINAQNLNQNLFQYASGSFLDNIGKLHGLSRLAATKTRVQATLFGVHDTVIPAGALARTVDGHLFELESTVTLDASGYSPANTYFASKQYGNIPCAANQLIYIDQNIVGWQTVTNASAAEPGREEETDSEYRDRISKCMYSGISFVESIYAAIMKCDGVVSCNILENGTANDNVSVNGVAMKRHSIYVCVEGGNEQDIAKAIYRTKACGCAFTDAITTNRHVINVIDILNNTHPITFYTPIEREIAIDVQVVNYHYSGYDLQQDVKDAIAKWAENKVNGAAGMAIGRDVSAFEISSAVSQLVGGIVVKSVLISGTGSGGEVTNGTFIPMSGNYLPTLGTVTVTETT